MEDEVQIEQPDQAEMTDEAAEQEFNSASTGGAMKPEPGAKPEGGLKPAGDSGDGKDDQPDKAEKIEKADKPKPDADKPDAKTPEQKRAEAMALAEQRVKEARDRRLELALDKIEGKKPDADKPDDAAAPSGFNVADIRTAIAEDLKAFKPADIEEFDSFEKFEKEYGEHVTNTIMAVSAAVARRMVESAVAPIQQRMQVEAIEKANRDFDARLESEFGIENPTALRSDTAFFEWLKADEQAGFRTLVETGDAKGTALVIQAYREEHGQPATKTEARTAASKVEAERAKTKEIHSSTSTGRRPVKAQTAADKEPETEEEAEALFNAAASKARG